MAECNNGSALTKGEIMERELVKIASDNPAFNGYYTQFKDMMKPGDVIYGTPIKPEPAEIIVLEKPTNKRKKR